MSIEDHMNFISGKIAITYCMPHESMQTKYHIDISLGMF